MSWLEVLKTECQKTSQRKVGNKLRQHQTDGFPSGTVINQALKGKYPGRLDRLQALVEGIYMSASVACPVMGDIPSDQCIHYQGRDFAATNPTRVRLHQACRSGCDHSSIQE